MISDTEEREESIWKARGAFLEAIKGSTTDMDEVDMVVPRNKVNEMVEYLHNLHNEVDIRIKSFGHAGDGNLHSYILKDDLSQEEFENEWQQQWKNLRKGCTVRWKSIRRTWNRICKETIFKRIS